MYIADLPETSFLRVCFGKVKGDARPDQLVTFARCRYEAPAITYRDLPPAARSQAGTFQFPGGNRDALPMDPQHFAEQVMSDLQRIRVGTVAHHEQPTRQTLLEAVCTVARDRHEDLLEKGLLVSEHEISELRHRRHRPCERRARHPCRAARDLDQKSDGGCLGTEDGLDSRATLPADRCHLDDAAVRI